MKIVGDCNSLLYVTAIPFCVHPHVRQWNVNHDVEPDPIMELESVPLSPRQTTELYQKMFYAGRPALTVTNSLTDVMSY